MTEETPEIIGGKNPVLEALRAKRDINKIWIAEGVQKKALQNFCNWQKNRKYWSSSYRKRKLTG